MHDAQITRCLTFSVILVFFPFLHHEEMTLRSTLYSASVTLAAILLEL